MTLGELLEERGLTDQDVAELLDRDGVRSATGKPIRPGSVRGRRGASIPKAWGPALGWTDPDTLEPGAEPEPGAGSSSGRREDAPRRPKEAAIAVVEAGAAKRIAGAYKFAGAALAAGSGSQGVAVVWGDQADRIAELWLEAAQDNPWAARFVNLMQSGGTTGDLAAAHLYLAGATLYVLGAGIPGGDSIFAKYSRHRPAARPVEQPAEPQPEPEPEYANGDRPGAGEGVDGAAAGAVANDQG